jgi:tetratricopeptide (TPR) repeat protein
MRSLASVLVLSLVASTALGAQHEHHASGGAAPAIMMEGLGNLHHPISTTSADAQKFFDQGLTLCYAFNHDEAVASFKRAAEIDPRCAMAYWGIAFALGPNINMERDAERDKAAYEALQKAIALAPSVPDAERDYIAALAKRYSNDPQADTGKLDRDFKVAMGELVAKYPDDLDAATIYAEAGMDLNPWRLWTPDGKPTEGTEEIVAVLESVLRRDPLHVGANHYYIHAVEASYNPERALPSAARLSGIAPAAGHLVHMPAHIWMRTGDYASAALSNEQAVAADQTYLAARKPQGMYPMMYVNHNYHFLAAAYTMAGNSAKAVDAADKLAATVGPMVAQMPMLDYFYPTPIWVRVRFKRWDEILKMPEPAKDAPLTRTMWRFARGMAFVATGKVAEAEAERRALDEVSKAVPEPLFGGALVKVTKVAATVLDARIAKAKGDAAGELALWRKAVEAQDAMGYNEPPDWYYPTRESLGGALLRGGKAAEAEVVFRDELKRNPRSGWALFGLRESLKTQGKLASIDAIQRQLDAAWLVADVQLAVGEL